MDVRAEVTQAGEELRPRSGGDTVLGLDVIPSPSVGPLELLCSAGVPVPEFHPSRCESLSLASLLYQAVLCCILVLMHALI